MHEFPNSRTRLIVPESIMPERPYQEDPELGDENDPEYKQEMFETFKVMRWTPDEITDPQYRKEYAEWLEDHHLLNEE
jgi:hypothetical protein